MKHVWILNHYAQEPGGPGGTRHYSLARHLPANGWRASIIAASIEHGTGRDRLSEGEAFRLETYNGIPFVWLKTSPYSGNGSARIRNMLEYAWQALRRDRLADLDPPDAIIGSSVHPFAALAGWRLARRHRVPFVFEVRDLWPQTLIDMGRLTPGSPGAQALRTIERFLYRRASRIITLLPRAADYIVPLGISEQKIVWISNGADVESFPATNVRDPVTGKFELMYFGSHGQANSLDTLIDAMHIIERSSPELPIRLRMIGEGPLKPALQDKVRRLGLTSVEFEPPVAKSAIPALASQADALVVCLRDLPRLYRYGISLNKLFDYLASARPVILAASVANNPVADAGAGLTVPPESPERLAEAIREMSSLPPAERARIGESGRRHVREMYGYDRLAARLASELDACCNEFS